MPVARRAVVVVALLAAVVMTVALALVPSPTPSVAQGSPLPIRIGYQAVASWVLFGARDLKLYEKAGLTPTFLKFTAGAPMIAW